MDQRNLSPCLRTPASLPGFRPLRDLWDSEAPLYPSEHSARWWLRQMRQDLIEEHAVIRHCGRLMVHPQRFAAVAERKAIDALRRRW